MNNVAIGALALAGVGIFVYSNRASAEIDAATPFTPLEQKEKDDKKQKIVNVESLIPTDLGSDSVWESRNQTFTFAHPLSATDSKFSQYKFTAKLTIDILASGAYSSWDSVPDTLQLGDYKWELSRQGGSWTVNANATDIQGIVTKSVLAQSYDSIEPTFNSILDAFGGYKPNYPAANIGSIQIQSGTFADTGGNWQYVDSNGNKVTKQQIVLDLNGNQITPEPLQMQVKCSGSSTWFDVSNPVSVVGSLIAENEDGTVKYFPADAPNGILPSGLSYGCTIPTETKSLPNSIRVIQDDGANTNYSNPTQISIDDLITSPYNVTVPKHNDAVSNETKIYNRLFASVSFPMVHKDGGGYYILNNNQKAYINTMIPGFDALYQRRQVQCTCPGGTVNAGTTVTLYDTKQCNPTAPSFVEEHCGGFGSSGGNDSGGNGGNSGGGDLTGSGSGGFFSLSQATTIQTNTTGNNLSLMSEQNLITNFQSYINW